MLLLLLFVVVVCMLLFVVVVVCCCFVCAVSQLEDLCGCSWHFASPQVEHE